MPSRSWSCAIPSDSEVRGERASSRMSQNGAHTSRRFYLRLPRRSGSSPPAPFLFSFNWARNRGSGRKPGRAVRRECEPQRSAGGTRGRSSRHASRAVYISIEAVARRRTAAHRSQHGTPHLGHGTADRPRRQTPLHTRRAGVRRRAEMHSRAEKVDSASTRERDGSRIATNSERIEGAARGGRAAWAKCGASAASVRAPVCADRGAQPNPAKPEPASSARTAHCRTTAVCRPPRSSQARAERAPAPARGGPVAGRRRGRPRVSPRRRGAGASASLSSVPGRVRPTMGAEVWRSRAPRHQAARSRPVSRRARYRPLRAPDRARRLQWPRDSSRDRAA